MRRSYEDFTRAGTNRAGVRFGVAVLLFAALLTACSTPRSQAPAAPQFTLTSDDLVGKWGLASYRVDTDRARTEVAAKAACSNPYVIAKGPNGGVMMYLADQSALQELFIKTGRDGGVYIGLQGPAGDPRDRHVVAYDGASMTDQWVDPDAAKRYGTMLYVRCGAAKS
jgi:hypothetical protein